MVGRIDIGIPKNLYYHRDVGVVILKWEGLTCRDRYPMTMF